MVAVVGAATSLMLGLSGCAGSGLTGPSDDTLARTAAEASALAKARQNALDNQVSDLEATKESLQDGLVRLRSSTTSPGTGPAVTSPDASSSPSVSGETTNPARTGSAGAASGSLGADFARMASSLSGRNGIAWAPVGSSSVSSVGTWGAGVAWSTIKAPLAIAAVRADGARPSSTTSALIRRAITASDNAAAEALWKRLGSGSKAATKVRTVLRDAGDPATVVQSSRVRPQFTPFGQTTWPLRSQAVFAARVSCIKGSAPVLRLMGQVTASQRWGLSLLGSSVRFKGGWGPGPSGGYLVRQLGVVRLPRGGEMGVAIASEPANGSFATGTSQLNAMTRWLRGRLFAMRGGSC